MKLGRLTAVHTQRSMRSALALARVLDPLGDPPPVPRDWRIAVDAATGDDWGMMGNEEVGDCTCADTGHSLMLRTANVGAMVTPTEADVLALYSAITGYVPGDEATDTGADETTVCAYNAATGLLGHKSDTYGSLDPYNAGHLRWCVELFGSCRLGIQVTPGMIQLFEQKQPWTAMGTDAAPGGHDVPIVYYDADYAYVVTWGGVQPVSWGLLADRSFLEEAHAELFFDWISAQGGSPSGATLNLNLLEQYMKEVDN